MLQDQPGQSCADSEWNGDSSEAELRLTAPATSDCASCDQKDSSELGEPGDPVAKAIEQRSYRCVFVVPAPFSWQGSINTINTMIDCCRLQELLESEKMYVSDLEQVYTYITYMRESKEKEEADIPMPDDLREGRDRMIFGNLENIYEWHRE